MNRWDLEAEPYKAYLNDKFDNEEFQLVDFMKKIGLEYPLDDADNPKGTVYEFWTKNLARGENNSLHPKTDPTKPGWKFW